MKLKQAVKKFSFIKALDIEEPQQKKVLNNLIVTFVGQDKELLTPLAEACGPYNFLGAFDKLFDSKRNLMNDTLQDLERCQRSKFSARSVAVPWIERRDGLVRSYSNQNENFTPSGFYDFDDDITLIPLSIDGAKSMLKEGKGSGLPFLIKKKDAIPILSTKFQDILARKDPAMLYTRTEDSKKTRNVWGYPIADSLFEQMFFYPFQEYERTLPYRKAMVSPEELSLAITRIILKAIDSGRVIYSIDFSMFDASVKFQYIILAFTQVKKRFPSSFSNFLDYICERFYTISIVTPEGILKGKHGVPSGSTWTNAIDSIVQVGIALTCSFLSVDYCQVQGDDGIYMLYRDEVKLLDAAFRNAGLNVNKPKSFVASNYAVFCQNLYHIDYLKDDGVIYGIYPIYRAIIHLLFQESYTDFSKVGITSKDYYGIRTISILEHCKHHPLHEDLVRFVYSREKYSLGFTEDGLIRYSNALNLPVDSLNHQYGTRVTGIRNFETFKVIQKIIGEEELCS